MPAEVRRHLRVGEKDKIVFVLRPDGGVELKVPLYPNVASLVGAAGSLKKPLEWQELRDLARQERIKDKFLRP